MRGTSAVSLAILARTYHQRPSSYFPGLFPPGSLGRLLMYWFDQAIYYREGMARTRGLDDDDLSEGLGLDSPSPRRNGHPDPTLADAPAVMGNDGRLRVVRPLAFVDDWPDLPPLDPLGQRE